MKHYTKPCPKTMSWPPYCCQRCGELYGYMGRFFHWLLGSIAHKCTNTDLYYGNNFTDEHWKGLQENNIKMNNRLDRINNLDDRKKK